MTDICAICLDDLVDTVQLSCRHMFCSRCIEQWTQTQERDPRCPVCRQVYLLPSHISDAIQFLSENLVWIDFIDIEDPGPVWEEYSAIEAQPWIIFNRRPRQRRDLYRHYVGEDRETPVGELMVRVSRNLGVYRYNYGLPNPAGLFDHWRDSFMDLDGSDPQRIAFYMANTGLARTDITSGPNDTAPVYLHYCPRCSRYVTSSLSLMRNHRCSTEYITVTTHYDY